jgi:hypothetical protein
MLPNRHTTLLVIVLLIAATSPSAQSQSHNGGATFMRFLAEEFGEGIHARLLRSPAKTFDEALANETKPYSLKQLFAKFQKWLE